MKPRERIEALLRGDTPDYVPFFPKISHTAHKAVPGMTVIDYMTSSDSMARAVMTAAQTYEYDAVGITTDIGNEGMALGSKYTRDLDETSKLVEYLLTSIDEYEKVIVRDPYEAEPTNTILRATAQVKREMGDQLYVTAWCNGPLNVASQLIPLEEIMYAMVDEPETLHKLLRRCADYSKNYAKALIEAGADAVSFGHAMASCTVISPQNYLEFAADYEKELVDAIHKAGGAAITHICGNIVPIAREIEKNGSEMMDFDHMCVLEQMLENTSCILRGNIDPALVANGTPGQVYEASCELVKRGKASKRFILGLGCEVSLNTPLENLAAMNNARLDCGRYI